MKKKLRLRHRFKSSKNSFFKTSLSRFFANPKLLKSLKLQDNMLQLPSKRNNKKFNLRRKSLRLNKKVKRSLICTHLHHQIVTRNLNIQRLQSNLNLVLHSSRDKPNLLLLQSKSQFMRIKRERGNYNRRKTLVILQIRIRIAPWCQNNNLRGEKLIIQNPLLLQRTYYKREWLRMVVEWSLIFRAIKRKRSDFK